MRLLLTSLLLALPVASAASLTGTAGPGGGVPV